MEQKDFGEYGDMVNNPDWVLYRGKIISCQVKLLFDSNEPTIRQVAALRYLIDEFRSMSSADVLKELRSKKAYLSNGMSLNDATTFIDKLSEHNIQASIIKPAEHYYIPYQKSTNCFRILEDEYLANLVIQEMMRTGTRIIDDIS